MSSSQTQQEHLTHSCPSSQVVKALEHLHSHLQVIHRGEDHQGLHMVSYHVPQNDNNNSDNNHHGDDRCNNGFRSKRRERVNGDTCLKTHALTSVCMCSLQM